MLEQMSISPTVAQFAPLSDVQAELGESPVWSPADKTIWWVDIVGCKVLRTSLAGETRHWDTPEMAGFVQYVAGEIFVGMQSGIFHFDPSSGRFEKRVELPLAGQRFNDACTDARGRIWAGSMDLENTRATGVLYLFDPKTGRLEAMLDGFRTINGLAWDEANGRLFLSDSHPDVQTVWTCEIGPDGHLKEREIFARFHDLEGRPDGAALDRAGHYWIAGVGGGVLYRFTPNGEAFTQVNVPVKSPTKPVLIDAPEPMLALTSFKDAQNGGKLCLWKHPPTGPDLSTGPIHERHIP